MTKFKAFAFLDRDGTINEEGTICKPSDLVLIPGAVEAIKLLNNANYCIVIISNQGKIAKGLCSEEDVKKVNSTLAKMLESKGCRVDAVYYCPHHPEKGHNCECRKPGVAMYRQAEKEFGLKIDKNSLVIGDQTGDIEAGKKLGCKTILLKTGWAGTDGKYSITADHECKNLLDAVRSILKIQMPNSD